MNYKIKLEKLNKIINPLEDKLLPVTISKIEDGLRKDNSDIKQKTDILSKIINRVLNYYPKEIEIDLRNIEESKGSIILTEENLIDLTAALFRQEEYIVGNIIGDAKIVKLLLDINLSKPDNIILEEDKKEELFNWQNVEESINHYIGFKNWSDPEFIYNHIKKLTFSGDKDKAFKEIISFADQNLWNDNNFLVELKDLYPNMLDQLPVEMYYRQSVFDFILANKDMHNAIEKCYLKLWNDREQLPDNNINSWSNKVYSITNKNRKDIAPILDQLKEKVFNNIDEALILIGQNSKYYAFFSEDVKYHSKMVNKIFNSKKPGGQFIEVNPFIDLPEKYKNDYSWVKDLLINYSDVLNLHTYKDSASMWHLTEYTKKDGMYACWHNDKNKVLDLINSVDHQDFGYFYLILPDFLKNDKDILQGFISKFSKVYAFFSEENKHTYIKDYIYIEKNKNELQNLINMEWVFKLNDRNVIVELIEKNVNRFMFKSTTPKKWRKDLELILAIKDDIAPLLEDKDIFKFLTKDEETILKILPKVPALYYKLPQIYKVNETIALQNLKYHNKIDNSLYLSREFCLKALSVKESCIIQIPAQFWNESSFLLSVCEKVDKGEYSKNLFKVAPVKIMQFFDNFNVKNDYASFLNKYIMNEKLKTNLNVSNVVKPIKKIKI